MPPNAPYQLFVGIDVAATTATCVWQTSTTSTPSRPITIPQTPDGCAQLGRRLTATGLAPATILIVLEATGSYWITLATTLHQAGFAVSVINPQQAHHFAKALLRRAKSDAIDAHTLALLAARLQPAPWTPPPAIYHELQQRLAQRDSLLDLRQQVRNQRHALVQGPVVIATVQARMDALLTTLPQQIEAVEAEIALVLQQDQAWATAAARLQNHPWHRSADRELAVGQHAELPQSRHPRPTHRVCRTGTHGPRVGTSVRARARIGHSGHRRMRTALYLATLSATRYNPVIRTFYQRLRAGGKPMKVARCAAARKLLHIAWAVVTKDCDFDPTCGAGTAGATGAPVAPAVPAPQPQTARGA